MQDETFPLNLALKYVMLSEIRVWSAEPDHAKLDRFDLDHSEPNRGLHRQIVMWNLHFSEMLCSAEW